MGNKNQNQIITSEELSGSRAFSKQRILEFLYQTISSSDAERERERG